MEIERRAVAHEFSYRTSMERAELLLMEIVENDLRFMVNKPGVFYTKPVITTYEHNGSVLYRAEYCVCRLSQVVIPPGKGSYIHPILVPHTCMADVPKSAMLPVCETFHPNPVCRCGEYLLEWSD